MSQLSKFTLKTFEKTIAKDPVVQRRNKLIAGIEIQKLVLATALKGKSYTIPAKKAAQGETGEANPESPPKTVRPWFFEQDAGWYVQCRYGARVPLIDGKSNAVFVQKLEEVGGVLAAFNDATAAGELDQALAAATKPKKG